MLLASEFQDLPEYKAYVRTMTSDRPAMPTGPHIVKLFPPLVAEGIENEKQRVIQTSLHRWTRSRAEVDAALVDFLASGSNV
jgi:hypothetical protein